MVRTLVFSPFVFLASELVRNSIEAMKQDGVDEVSFSSLLQSLMFQHTFRSFWKQSTTTMLRFRFMSPSVSYARSDFTDFT